MPTIDIIQADLDRQDHADAVIEMIDAYSQDPMGDGKPLDDDVREQLIPGLKEYPTTCILLAYDESTPVGVAVCFQGFSTFRARPLVNIHDIAVIPSHRGQGVGRMLLDAVSEKARELGCCKVTLEVLENNHRARKAYEDNGFRQATYQEAAGGALFMAKQL